MSAPATPGERAEAMINRLAGHGPIEIPAALVVAHPDDEAIAMAGTLCRFTRLVVIHVTAGSPAGPPGQDLSVAETVARQREAEVTAALRAAAARPEKCLAYRFTDGSVLDALPELTDRLAADLLDAEVVFTHPFEGGHVDHDACAMAVQGACARLGEAAPGRLEFASYHNRRNRVATGSFWPDDACREVLVRLSEAAMQRRAAAFACHRSQEGNLRFFTLAAERFRTAPVYDFEAPAPPGRTLYGSEAETRVRQAGMALAGRDSLA